MLIGKKLQIILIIGISNMISSVARERYENTFDTNKNSSDPTAAVFNSEPLSTLPLYSSLKLDAAIVIAILSFSSKSLKMARGASSFVLEAK